MSTSKSKILLIYTGGTIGMMKDFATGALKAFDFEKLESHVPELQQLDCDIETISFEHPIDSSNMNLVYWIKIAEIITEQYSSYDGFVILHGSDTMSYSASALSFMLENLAKPVIFTGSQLPIGDLRTDAKENLITAIQIASLQHNGKPVVSEVCLYFEYKLYRGNRTTKINAEHFNAFASPNYPALAESGVHLKVESHLLLKPHPAKKFIFHREMNPNVVVIKIFPGMTAEVLEAIFAIPTLKGVVLETYGAGNAPTEDWLVAILRKAIARGVYIINVSQCSAGSVSMGQYETSTLLKEIGVITGKDMTTETAVAKLMYLLGQNVSAEVFKTIFETPLRGEMS